LITAAILFVVGVIGIVFFRLTYSKKVYEIITLFRSTCHPSYLFFRIVKKI
jgi:hypothetical protein